MLIVHTKSAKIEPSNHDDVTVCQNLLTAVEEKTTAQKSVISPRTVSGLNVTPVGFCIHAFATRIQTAETVAPIIVSQVEAK